MHISQFCSYAVQVRIAGIKSVMSANLYQVRLLSLSLNPLLEIYFFSSMLDKQLSVLASPGK